MNFSKSQLEQIQEKGIKQNDVLSQVEIFKKGIPFLNITRPAGINDGILSLDKEQISHLVQKYESHSGDKKVLKFVPASGAASRMFKQLFEFTQAESDDISSNPFIEKFISQIEHFAFIDELKTTIAKQGDSFEQLMEYKEYRKLVSFVIEEKGLNYGNLPKGALKFHHENNWIKTAVEEHLTEGAMYAASKNGEVNLHFTVSPAHMDLFKELIDQVRTSYEDKYEVHYNIEFSVQKESTDTIAVDLNNEPFLDAKEALVFRPGGHGALLENINELNADIVFVKNIDNVVKDSLKEETVTYKKVLAGLLIELQEQVAAYLKDLTNKPSSELLQSIELFMQEKLGTACPLNISEAKLEEKTEYLKSMLNRPIRVCGMVKNEGEPGGGPFWVKQNNGTSSLQIVETSQINMNDTNQAVILKGASHFNPVDLVCGLKNVNGEAFDLLKYRDPDTGFISMKSKDGKDLKALELPGLWNGAMANWNTIFVEVPLITFNPVKTVNDLLRNEHQ